MRRAGKPDRDADGSRDARPVTRRSSGKGASRREAESRGDPGAQREDRDLPERDHADPPDEQVEAERDDRVDDDRRHLP